MNVAFAPHDESEVFSLSERDGVLVLELRGELGSLRWKSRNESEVLAAVDGIARPRLVIELGHATYCGSQLVAFLFRLRRKLRASGGQIVLAGVKGDVRNVLRVVQLDRVLPVFESTDAAVAALNGDEAYAETEIRPA